MKKILLLAVIFLSMAAQTEGSENLNSKTNSGNYFHLTERDSVSTLINHPAFAGFGSHLMPWDNRVYDADTPLYSVGQFMPYHGHIEPYTVVRALNRMIDDASEGKTIFYDFYTERQKQDDPNKKSAGLFFFRGNRGAPFAIICPGGGFSYVGALHEGFPLAAEISEKGYNAFVLRYRVGSEARATEDLAAAISFIFRKRETLGVSTAEYSIWGGSAGARMTANVGSNGVAYYGGDDVGKPAAVVIAYTGHSAFSKEEPPTFTVVGENDGIANPGVMERRVNAMRDAGLEVEFHKYKNVGHGFGLGVGTSAEGWLDDAVRFWEKHIARNSR
ncbi:hypothetical protein FACS1894187_12800 [Synergistales bacterium]|nr:hypothetical protein FACS1894187_12800 [Synergistales bacterium]